MDLPECMTLRERQRDGWEGRDGWDGADGMGRGSGDGEQLRIRQMEEGKLKGGNMR